jgi:hypothetical protein
VEHNCTKVRGSWPLKSDSGAGADSFGPSKILVSGAGTPVVNGVYERAGLLDGVPMYSRIDTDFGGVTVSLYRHNCNVNGLDRHLWFFSFLHNAKYPSGDNDIDFYYAFGDDINLPPQTGA